MCPGRLAERRAIHAPVGKLLARLHEETRGTADLGKAPRAYLRRPRQVLRSCGGLRVDLDENPLTKGVISSEQAMRGYKAAADAALGRGSQALTEWIESFG